MVRLGYTLSSEEHPPNDLVRYAVQAEEKGFDFAMISDHYHPWVDRQGHSPFVWSVIGGVAQATSRLELGTGVTCPIIRIHPAILAQAATTAEAMMPGRFRFGVGTGENLNEHVVAERWPSADERLDMLEEAIEAIRQLWEGGMQSFHGTYFHIEDARIYTLPEQLPPILVAAKGKGALELAGRLGDGLIGVTPDRDMLEEFERAGGHGKPRFGQIHVCWAETDAEARRTAHAWWPNAAIEGELGVELPAPRHFEQAAAMVTEDDVAGRVVCGPDPERHLEEIRTFADAGYDHVYVHQIGPDQDAFFRFYEREVLPKLG
ncbi:MAG TPA: TIGR03557 family F420-dependent LLM class oxidoreductase [Actinomycetota bacterium]|jgi:G6PDH family F420-dependent oxidoreductase|nr:TIGR03557 family F420-dependent LLM class oxidoreductase [Actinomycetota bacterium]